MRFGIFLCIVLICKFVLANENKIILLQSATKGVPPLKDLVPVTDSPNSTVFVQLPFSKSHLKVRPKDPKTPGIP
jgi:hypothetical protein